MRIATFNCENLFSRYNFKKGVNPTTDGFTINDLAFDLIHEESKKFTADAIMEINPDVIGLQEIEGLGALEYFNEKYLSSMNYKYKLLIDSHDPRGIDVGFLSRYPIGNIRTHRDETTSGSNSYIFSRDCLEVEVEINEKSLFLYINHFKSMLGGREETAKKRYAQAQRVADIIDNHWKSVNYNGNFVVLGDLNDYPDETTSLGPLLNHPNLVNVIKFLPESERWTHYFAGDKTYHQLDYLFVSDALIKNNPECFVGIMRKGMAKRATKYTGTRFEGIGEDNPKASDHAPFYIDLNLI